MLQPLDIFSDIDPEPLGAASLAQVHKAHLKDGSTVAIKVQHPYVKGNSIIDIKTMEVIISSCWTYYNNCSNNLCIAVIITMLGDR